MKTGIVCCFALLLFFDLAIAQEQLAVDCFETHSSCSTDRSVALTEGSVLSGGQLAAYLGLAAALAVVTGVTWWYHRQRCTEQLAQGRSLYQQQSGVLVEQVREQRLALAAATQHVRLEQEHCQRQTQELQRVLEGLRAEHERMVLALQHENKARLERVAVLEKLCAELQVRQQTQFTNACDQMERLVTTWRAQKDESLGKQAEQIAAMRAEHKRIMESMSQQVTLFAREKATAEKNLKDLKDQCWRDTVQMVKDCGVEMGVPPLRVGDEFKPLCLK